MKIIVIAIFLYCWLAPNLFAADRAEIQKRIASFLLIAKQMNAGEVSTSSNRSICSDCHPTTPDFESDLTPRQFFLKFLKEITKKYLPIGIVDATINHVPVYV